MDGGGGCCEASSIIVWLSLCTWAMPTRRRCSDPFSDGGGGEALRDSEECEG